MSETLDKGRRIATLINQFRFGSLSAADREELEQWVNASEANQKVFEELIDKINIISSLQWTAHLEAIHSHKKLVRIHPAWIAAAVIIVIAGISIIVQQKKSSPAQAMATNTVTILPGSPKAILTTSTGASIALGKIKNGLIKIDDKSQAIAHNDKLIYDHNDAITYMHTLSTPPGGEFQLQLPDGTKVWLNAASSITYPTSFAETERVRSVTITGECYFEVTHMEGKPFIVKQNDNMITVIGTAFNVNAYKDETVSVSLLKGQIELQTPKQKARLIKGEKSFINNQTLTTTKDNSISEDIAWTQGLFSFRRTSIKEVMNQVARWYDININYEQDIQRTFTGRIRRSSTLDEVLKMLELSASIQFDIKGKTVTVRNR